MEPLARMGPQGGQSLVFILLSLFIKLCGLLSSDLICYIVNI